MIGRVLSVLFLNSMTRFLAKKWYGCLNEADLLNDNIRNESSEALLDDTNPRENAEKYLQHVALHLNSSTKDLKIAHLNIC